MARLGKIHITEKTGTGHIVPSPSKHTRLVTIRECTYTMVVQFQMHAPRTLSNLQTSGILVTIDNTIRSWGRRVSTA